MRVLHVFHGKGFVGGSSFSMSSLAVGLNHRSDIDVFVATPWTPKHEMKRYLDSRGVRVFELPIVQMMGQIQEGATLKGRIKQRIKRIVNYIDNLYIAYLIRKYSFELVHIGGAVIDCGVKPALKRGVPVVWHLREYCDLDWGLYPYLQDEYDWEMGKASACIAVSHSIAEYYRKKNKMINVIYNGIIPEEDLHQSAYPVDPHSDRAQVQLGYFGGIRESKGLFELLEAIRILNESDINLSLDIYGSADPSDMERFKEEMLDSRLSDQVCYKGWSDITLNTYRQHDFVIVASRHEAFGRVTAEAQLAKVPVIGADSDGTRELLSGGRGLLYSPGDAQSLADGIKWALSHGEEIKTYVDNAYQYASSHFTADRYVSSVADLYHCLLSAK